MNTFHVILSNAPAETLDFSALIAATAAGLTAIISVTAIVVQYISNKNSYNKLFHNHQRQERFKSVSVFLYPLIIQLRKLNDELAGIDSKKLLYYAANGNLDIDDKLKYNKIKKALNEFLEWASSCNEIFIANAELTASFFELLRFAHYVKKPSKDKETYVPNLEDFAQGVEKEIKRLSYE